MTKVSESKTLQRCTTDEFCQKEKNGKTGYTYKNNDSKLMHSLKPKIQNAFKGTHTFICILVFLGVSLVWEWTHS